MIIIAASFSKIRRNFSKEQKLGFSHKLYISSILFINVFGKHIEDHKEVKIKVIVLITVYELNLIVAKFELIRYV